MFFEPREPSQSPSLPTYNRKIIMANIRTPRSSKRGRGKYLFPNSYARFLCRGSRINKVSGDHPGGTSYIRLYKTQIVTFGMFRGSWCVIRPCFRPWWTKRPCFESPLHRFPHLSKSILASLDTEGSNSLLMEQTSSGSLADPRGRNSPRTGRK